MSSFIHSSKHFNSIEKGLIELFKNRDFGTYWAGPYGLKNAPRELSGPEIESKLTKITDELRVLNVVCVCFQYKHHTPGEGELNEEIRTNLIAVRDRTTGHRHLTKKGLYQALRSLNYQIEIEHIEGVTTELDPAYNFLQTVLDHLAHDIAIDACEGENWSID